MYKIFFIEEGRKQYECKKNDAKVCLWLSIDALFNVGCMNRHVVSFIRGLLDQITDLNYQETPNRSKDIKKTRKCSQLFVKPAFGAGAAACSAPDSSLGCYFQCLIAFSTIRFEFLTSLCLISIQLKNYNWPISWIHLSCVSMGLLIFGFEIT